MFVIAGGILLALFALFFIEPLIKIAVWVICTGFVIFLFTMLVVIIGDMA